MGGSSSESGLGGVLSDRYVIFLVLIALSGWTSPRTISIFWLWLSLQWLSSSAKQVIAKLDRLSRNLALIATMMDSGEEFVAVDNTHANKLTLHVLAAVAQHKREMIAGTHQSCPESRKTSSLSIIPTPTS